VPGKTPEKAIETFAGFMSETLSCLTGRRLDAFQKSANTFALLYKNPVLIRSSNGERFYLHIAQVCSTEECEDGSFKAHTREYNYVFSDSPSQDHHGILSYHWHPERFEVRHPHLHIRFTAQTGSPLIEHKISRAHFPTSRVCLEDFVMLLLDYYDIRSPIGNHESNKILKRNKKAFSKGATWTIGHP
jgi:hypothetical protein